MTARLKKEQLALKEKIALAAFSALLLVFSFPGFNLWFLAFFAFIPLFYLLERSTPRQAFCLAYLFGLIFWWGNIYWLINVTFLGTAVLILYLSLYPALFALVFKRHFRGNSLPGIIITGLFWVILEFLRSYLLTGFPWSLLAYTQQFNPVFIQSADIAGAWGVSFLVILVNLLAYLFLNSLLRRQKLPRMIFIPLLIISCALLYGFYKLHAPLARGRSGALRVCVVQGNIPQELKWDPKEREFITEKYCALTRKASAGNPDLVIWPEAALPVVLQDEPAVFARVEKLAREIKIPILLGAVTRRGGSYYNSAIMVSSTGQVSNFYDKLHLVPFGEYIPLRKTLPFLETIAPIGDIEKGRQFTIFQVNPRNRAEAGGNLGVLICFEDLFPELSAGFVRKGAGFLVNITNDAWYMKTAAAAQHFQASVFRAVENNVFLVRSANTGISGFISPRGQIISLVSDKEGNVIFIDGYLSEEIVLGQKNLTFYSRFGDIFILLVSFYLFGALLLSRKKQ